MTTRQIEQDVEGIATALARGDVLGAKWKTLSLLVSLRREHDAEDAHHDAAEADTIPLNAEAA
jgi:hypothetical protein